MSTETQARSARASVADAAAPCFAQMQWDMCCQDDVKKGFGHRKSFVVISKMPKKTRFIEQGDSSDSALWRACLRFRTSGSCHTVSKDLWKFCRPARCALDVKACPPHADSCFALRMARSRISYARERTLHIAGASAWGTWHVELYRSYRLSTATSGRLDYVDKMPHVWPTCAKNLHRGQREFLHAARRAKLREPSDLLLIAGFTATNIGA